MDFAQLELKLPLSWLESAARKSWTFFINLHPHGFPANHHGRFLQFGYWILELCRVLNFVGMTEGLFCSFLVYILGIQSLRCRIFHLVKQAARTVWETLFFHTENVKLFLWAKISRRYLNLIQLKDFIFFQFESFLHDCVKTEQPIIVLYEKCEENLFRWLELWLHTDCSWFGWIWTYMYWHTGFCISDFNAAECSDIVLFL